MTLQQTTSRRSAERRAKLNRNPYRRRLRLLVWFCDAMEAAREGALPRNEREKRVAEMVALGVVPKLCKCNQDVLILRKGGKFSTYCPACDRAYQEQMRAKRSPEQKTTIANYVKEWRKTHKSNRDTVKYKKWQREYHQRPVVKERTRLLSNKRYHQKKHSEEFKARRRKYHAKWKSYPENRLALNLRRRLGLAIREQAGCKSAATMTLIGCTAKELRAHLESQFRDGMAWHNYGKTGWHVDHIKPCSHFDLTKPDDQRRCFHYANLQPLWGVENSSKRDRAQPYLKYAPK